MCYCRRQDQTILATAAPVISDDFHTTTDLGWWSNAYLLSLSSFQLSYGKLYSVFSINIVYLVAVAIFEVGSLVCTIAPTATALAIGRAVAGLGAAGIFVSLEIRDLDDLRCSLNHLLANGGVHWS